MVSESPPRCSISNVMAGCKTAFNRTRIPVSKFFQNNYINEMDHNVLNQRIKLPNPNASFLSVTKLTDFEKTQNV